MLELVHGISVFAIAAFPSDKILFLNSSEDTKTQIESNSVVDIAPVSTTYPWNVCDIKAISSFQIKKLYEPLFGILKRIELCFCENMKRKSAKERLRFRGQNATSFKEEEKYMILAVVRYPSLSIDLLYDFKKVQPMPNHPVIFSSLPIKYKKIRHLLSPFSPSLSHIAFVSGR